MGTDTKLPDYKQELNHELWAMLCKSIGVQTSAFNRNDFRRFFEKNRHGLAQLHAAIFKVNLDSLGTSASSWARGLWDGLRFKPGDRVTVTSGVHTGQSGIALGCVRP